MPEPISVIPEHYWCTHAEIKFTDGTIEGVDGCGPLLCGDGMGENFRAFRILRNLKGLSAPRASVRFSSIEPRYITRGFFFRRWSYRRNLANRFANFTDITLTTVDDLILNEQNSSFPPCPAHQIQIYNGKLRLSWSQGDIIIEATVTLKYPPNPGATITGIIVGTMIPPIDPFTRRRMTVEFYSKNPTRPGICGSDDTEIYPVEDFIFRSRLTD